MTARPPDLSYPVAGGDTVRFSFTPRPEHVSLARLVAATMAERHGLPPETVDDVRLVVSEACTNAVRAQRRLRRGSPISMTCTCNGDGEFRIEVADSGGGFRPPTGSAHLPEGEEDGGGYGIPLMQHIADRATFESDGDGGTVVRLTVGFDRAVPRGDP